MHDLSFDFGSPMFTVFGFTFSVDIYTFENVYTLKKSACITSHNKSDFHLSCTEFSYAGGQQFCLGELWLSASLIGGNIQITMEAKAPKIIRNIKLTLHHIPQGNIVNLRENEEVIVPQEGSIYTYPSGWRGLYTPLLVLKTDVNSFLYFRSLDTLVREKKFAIRRVDHEFAMELIFEETGANMASRLLVPDWEIGYGSCLDEIMEKQNNHLKSAFHLLPWEERKDVPEWMKDISLVASIHMEHWTGYVFHDYESVIDSVKWLTNHIEPKRILVYLPGWDGRYYWNYGHYKPSQSLGGEDGFIYMLSELRKMGVHTMLMVGLNLVNRCTQNFEQWGQPSISTNVSGLPQTSLVDWDGSRHYQHGFNVMLSIGANLCLGDKGRHSTGVHELGYNPITNSPFRKGIIPTITIVENTITDYPDLVMDTIHTAKRYAVEFLEE